MTTSGTADQSISGTDRPDPQQQPRDWLLENLVIMANELGTEYGVTLLVGGTIVTGVIISGRSYFEQFAEEAAGMYADTETAKAAKEAYLSHKDFYPPRAAGDDNPSIPANYIHLRDAKFIANGHSPIPNNRGVLWRARLSCVDAFNLGTMS